MSVDPSHSQRQWGLSLRTLLPWIQQQTCPWTGHILLLTQQTAGHQPSCCSSFSTSATEESRPDDRGSIFDLWNLWLLWQRCRLHLEPQAGWMWEERRVQHGAQMDWGGSPELQTRAVTLICNGGLIPACVFWHVAALWRRSDSQCVMMGNSQ